MSRIALSGWRYRALDRTSKLLGVGLVAAGLEVGGTTPIGFGLGLAGAILGLLTVIIDHQ